MFKTVSMRESKEKQFKQIVNENGDRIMRICRYYNSNSEDQKDMYQEILVNVWKSLDHFRGDSKVSTWVYRIAVNTSLKFAGKAYKHLKLMVDKDVQNLNILFDEDEADLIEQQELDFEKLLAHLNLLSVIDKAMISLMLEGLSTHEISDIIGLTEINVRVKIHRIKEKLRSQLLINSN
jgi:RNA polymerase sigma-70 factor, ECF subfamily